MTTDAKINLEELDAALASAAPKLSGSEQRLAVTIYRTLATGQPVTVDAAATATGADAGDVERTLRSWPGVFRDNDGSVIGYWGLALREMPHRLRVAEVSLFAWCAWDPCSWPTSSGRSASRPTIPLRANHQLPHQYRRYDPGSDTR
jgi:hypothetical protein